MSGQCVNRVCRTVTNRIALLVAHACVLFNCHDDMMLQGRRSCAVSRWQSSDGILDAPAGVCWPGLACAQQAACEGFHGMLLLHPVMMEKLDGCP